MKVIKIGGSLLDRAERILEVLRDKEVLIVPGGGIFADTVREVYKDYSVGETAAHFMAVYAMNIYGLYLEDKGGISAREKAEGELPAILLPYKFIKERDELPHSWSVTSDSIACYIAAELGAEELILLKSVEGITKGGKLVDVISTGELKGMKQSVVDSFLSRIVEEYRIRCRILNGRRLESLKSFLNGNSEGTLIVP